MPSSRARSLVIWSSLTLALAGWCGGAWAWIALGVAAGVHPGFILALTMACTFSVTFAITAVMPDKARLFALGFREGAEFADAHQPEPEPARRLTVAR